MTTRLAAATAIAMVNALTALIDDGSVLEIYNGAMPATADTALSGQTLLAAFPLASPDAFADAVDTVNGAVATANAVAAQDGLATDTATWGRIISSTDAVILIGDVSLPAGAGAIKISSVNITAGIELSVISLSYTQPKA
jgi:hypothetical protein